MYHKNWASAVIAELMYVYRGYTVNNIQGFLPVVVCLFTVSSSSLSIFGLLGDAPVLLSSSVAVCIWGLSWDAIVVLRAHCNTEYACFLILALSTRTSISIFLNPWCDVITLSLWSLELVTPCARASACNVHNEDKVSACWIALQLYNSKGNGLVWWQPIFIEGDKYESTTEVPSVNMVNCRACLCLN